MPRRRYTPEQQENLVSRYDAGESIDALARSVGVSFSTMKENLHRWGAGIRRRGPPRLYELNERFFERLDTPEKAYWAGFILADGSVNKTGAGNLVLRVELAVQDRAHLRELGLSLGYNGPIKDDPSKGKYGSSYISICSAPLVRDLAQWGVVPNKTHICSLPEVCSALRSPLLRGYFDGDGCFYAGGRSEDNQVSVTISGTRAVCERSQAWLIEAGVATEVQLVRFLSGSTTWGYRKTGTNVVERIMNWLYASPGPRLARKYAAYRHAYGKGVDHG